MQCRDTSEPRWGSSSACKLHTCNGSAYDFISGTERYSFTSASVFLQAQGAAAISASFANKCYVPLSVASTAQHFLCWSPSSGYTWMSDLWGIFKATCLFLNSLLLFQLLGNQNVDSCFHPLIIHISNSQIQVPRKQHSMAHIWSYTW